MVSSMNGVIFMKLHHFHGNSSINISLRVKLILFSAVYAEWLVGLDSCEGVIGFLYVEFIIYTKIESLHI